MATVIQCPTCQKKMQVQDNALGKKVRCPGCQGVFEATREEFPAPVSIPKKEPAPQVSVERQRTVSAPVSSLDITCPACGKRLQVPSSAAGKQARCSGCKSLVAIPSAAAVVSSPKKSPPSGGFAGGGGLEQGMWDLPATQAFGSANPSGAQWSQPMGSPYASPGPGAYGGYAAAPRAAGQRSPALYIIPAVFMLLWGFLLLGVSSLRVVLSILAVVNLPPNAVIDYPKFIGFIVGLMIAFLVSIVIIAGSLTMMLRKNLSLSRSAAITAAIPCFGGLAFPFGIWAWVLLYSGPAKKDFSS